MPPSVSSYRMYTLVLHEIPVRPIYSLIRRILVVPGLTRNSSHPQAWRNNELDCRGHGSIGLDRIRRLFRRDVGWGRCLKISKFV